MIPMPRAGLRPPGARRVRGYALPLVLGALALIALVAGRFAQRIDQLRAQAQTLQGYAEARVAAASARSVGEFWIATREPGPVGFGTAAELVRADDTPYALTGGAILQLQDQRGLIPLNIPDLSFLRALLQQQPGLDAAQIDRMIDGLLDYADTDSLHRLNGAEAPEYRFQDLPPPRDDWLLSVSELGQVMAWRGQAALIQRLEPLLSLARVGVFNPMTAPMPVLEAWFGKAAAPQLQLFDTLRHGPGLVYASQVQSLTGLPMKRDDLVFYVSDEVALSVWAPGLPRPLQYNLLLLPAGESAPWLVLQARPRAALERRDDQPPPKAFPLAIPTAASGAQP